MIESMDLGVYQTQVQIPATPLTSYVTVSELLRLSIK